MPTLNFPSIVPSSVSFGIKYNTQINISTLSGTVQTVEVPGARWVADLSFDDMQAAESRVLAAFLAELRGASGRFYLYDHSHKDPRGSNLAAGVVIVDTLQAATIATGNADGTHSTTTIEDAGETFITDEIISVGDYIYNVPNTELRIIESFTETVITVTAAWTQPTAAQAYEIRPAFSSSVTTSGWDATETGVLEVGDYIELEGNELKIVTSIVTSDGSGDAVINFEPPIRIQPSNGSTILRSSCETVMLLSDDESRWDTNNAGLLANINLSCMEGF